MRKEKSAKASEKNQAVHKRTLKKRDCRFHEMTYCWKFRCRCVDCKEYLIQPEYVRKKMGDENWSHVM